MCARARHWGYASGKAPAAAAGACAREDWQRGQRRQRSRWHRSLPPVHWQCSPTALGVDVDPRPAAGAAGGESRRLSTLGVSAAESRPCQCPDQPTSLHCCLQLGCSESHSVTQCESAQTLRLRVRWLASRPAGCRSVGLAGLSDYY